METAERADTTSNMKTIRHNSPSINYHDKHVNSPGACRSCSECYSRIRITFRLLHPHLLDVNKVRIGADVDLSLVGCTLGIPNVIGVVVMNFLPSSIFPLLLTALVNWNFFSKSFAVNEDCVVWNGLAKLVIRC